MKNKRLFLLPATIAAGFNLLGTNLQAGTTWDGGATSNTNINAANNWDANVVNALNGTTTATFGTGGSTATINVAASFTGITINRAVDFTIADGAGALTVGTGGITVTLPTTTGRTHAINESSLVLNGAQTWTVTNNTGAAVLKVSSVISGTAASNLSKAGGGILTLSNANTYLGSTTITAGTLRLENTAAVASTSEVRVQSSSTLQLGTDTAFSSVPTLLLTGGTVSSDRLTAGAGITHVLGNAAVSNAVQTFARGNNVTSGDAAVQLGNITNSSGSGGTATLNPTTANLIVTGGYTGITNTGSNTLTLSGSAAANSMAGNIALGTRTTINFSKINNSVWTLSGTNTGLNGTTNVTGGALITTNLAALPNSSAVTFDGGTIGAVMGTSPANWSTSEVDNLLSTATKTSGAIGIDTTNAGLTQWTPFTTTNLGPLGLTKLGTNTLTLDQASNNYTGATTIAQGTLKLDLDHTLTGSLNFGIASGTTSPTGTLDLATTNVNATFGGLNVVTNSATANTITIGSGKTLTLTGSAVSNVVSVGTAAVAGSAKLQVTGAGTLTVSDATRNIVVANTAASNNASTAQMDLSGLSTFNANIANLYVGRPTNSIGATANGVPNDILTLAGSNTINATGNIAVGGSATGGATGTSKLILGTANTLEAALFTVGGARSAGTMEFNTGLTNPAVTLRGAGGVGTRTNIYLGDALNANGVFNGASGSNTSTGTMNFTGGTVTASVNNLFVAVGAGSVGANRGRAIGSFTMDGTSSNVDINNLVIAQNADDTTAAVVTGGNPTSQGTFTVTNGTLQVNTALTLANDIDTTATASGVQNVQATFAVAGGNATIGTLSTPVNMILGNQVTAGNNGVITAAVSVTGGTLNVFGDIKEGNLGAGTITSSLSLAGGTLDMKGGKITNLDTISYTSGTLKNLGVVNTGMSLAGTGTRVFDQGATHLLGAVEGAITGTGVGLDKQGLGKLTLSGTNTYDGVTTVTAGTLQIAKEASLYNAAPASWTAANINVKSAATLALNVDSAGTAGFTSASIDTLLTNISVANTAAEGLQAGAILGLDTSTATGGTFTQGSAIADSTGSGAFHGAIGLTKSGAGILILDKANTYSGATTVTAGTLELADNSAAGTSAGGITLSGALAATLQINTGITTADDITFSNTNAASNVKRTVAAATGLNANDNYTTGTSGALKSSLIGGADTTAQILAGTNSAATDTTLTMSFSATNAATNDAIRRSDAFSVSGTTGTDAYVLQLTASGLAADSVLGYSDGSVWNWAVTNNTGAGSLAGYYAQSWTSFFTANGGIFNADMLGAHGYDSGGTSVWAVVNYGSVSGSFAAVPEPTSALAGLLIGAGLLRRRRAAHQNL